MLSIRAEIDDSIHVDVNGGHVHSTEAFEVLNLVGKDATNGDSSKSIIPRLDCKGTEVRKCTQGSIDSKKQMR